MIFKTQFIFPGKMLIQGDPVDLLNVIHYFSYSISTARSQRLMKHYSSYNIYSQNILKYTKCYIMQWNKRQKCCVTTMTHDVTAFRFPPTTVVAYANII